MREVELIITREIMLSISVIVLVACCVGIIDIAIIVKFLTLIAAVLLLQLFLLQYFNFIF